MERLQQRSGRQRSSSVYLDTPTPRPNRRPTSPPRSVRQTAASICLVVGLTSLALAGLMAVFQTLTADSASIEEAVEEMLDDPVARPELQAEIATGIEEGLVGQELSDVVALYGFDVETEADTVALAILDDPAVRDEVRLLVVDIHSRMFVEPARRDLDLRPLSTATLAVITRESPQLADIVPARATLWRVDASTIPDLTWTTDMIDRGLVALLLGGLLVPVGVVLHPRRHRATAWIGRSILVAGVFLGIAAVGLPYLVGAVSGLPASEIAVRSITLSLLAPAALGGVIGVTLVSFAAVVKHREDRLLADEGAAAALGYDEPPLWTQPANPSLDLAHRGLVDVNHPLTNI